MLRITWIGIEGRPEEPDREIAFEVDFGHTNALPAGDDAIAQALALIAPSYYQLKESRGQFNWGAGGPDAQSIEVMYAVAVAAQVSGAAITAAFDHVLRRLHRPKTLDAERVGRRYGDVLERAFKVQDVKLAEVRRDGNEWFVAADADGDRYEGKVSDDGVVVEARRLRRSTTRRRVK